jgi:hypothetical protein
VPWWVASERAQHTLGFADERLGERASPVSSLVLLRVLGPVVLKAARPQLAVGLHPVQHERLVSLAAIAGLDDEEP